MNRLEKVNKSQRIREGNLEYASNSGIPTQDCMCLDAVNRSSYATDVSNSLASIDGLVIS